jgi:serine/threonine protein kinase
MSVENLIGQTVGQCELRELLGIGGMGAVYRSYQKNLKREVAVKVISTSLSQQIGYRERFFLEAQTSAALEDAHIIPIYDFGTQGQISYLVMRLLTGGSLAERIHQHAESNLVPSLLDAVHLLNQLARALDYAHNQGVIQRDIKPANILFDNQGRAFIVDFGIAKLVSGMATLTGTGIVMGSPSYMPRNNGVESR